MSQQGLIFANGDPHPGAMVDAALALAAQRDTLIVAADGGARIAEYYGLTPHIVIGDMDSLSAGEVAALRERGADIRQFPEEKDETDLELALTLAVERGARWLRVIGAIGDRLDQTLSNVSLLALPALANCDARMIAGKQEAWLIGAGAHEIAGSPGDTLSLLPMTGTVRGVRTEALYYPLRDEDLFFGLTRGVSNVMQASSARVHVAEGVLLVVRTLGRA